MVIGYLTSCYASATDTFIRAEVLGLRRRGHVVHTFSIRRPPPGDAVGQEIRDEQAGTVYLVPDQLAAVPLAALRLLLGSPRRFIGALVLAWRTRGRGLRQGLLQLAYLLEATVLALRLRERRIEHLHNHIAENSATVALLASALAGVPHSLTEHGSGVFSAPERWALGEKIARARFTACISEFTRSQCLLQAAQADWPKLQLVRCAPAAAFLAADPPPPVRSDRLLWIGRMVSAKGLPVLLEAAQQLARDGLDFRLDLLGDGPLRPLIERELRARGLAGHVHLEGYGGGERVRDAILAAGVLVLPSLAEGLPVVLMEAMALGRPVISTYIGGIPELVEPGVSGWLVPAGSADRLAGALREALARPPAELWQMGMAGRRTVQRRHDPEVQIDRLERLIAESVAGGPP